jgi:two-component system, OmpR family, phosphate regulon sensor histidine kinase PhoR
VTSYIESDYRLKRLRWLLSLLFLTLAIPAGLLIRQGFAQIELAEFRRQQLIAEDLVRSIDTRLATAISVENARPATDFDYAVTSEGAGNIVQLSPLSSLDAANAFPGTVGYFQVDAAGQLSTPLLPATAREAVPEDVRQAKTSVEEELADVLEANRLVDFRDTPPARARTQETRFELESADDDSIGNPDRQASIRGQAAFDELVGASEPEAQARPDAAEADQIVVTGARAAAAAPGAVNVSTFAGEIEPLRFSLLETGHLVLFRNAWRDNERYVQGMLIDRDSFVERSIRQPFVNAGLAPGTGLSVSVADAAIAKLEIDDSPSDGSVDGSSLYTSRLSPPLAELEVSFAAGILNRGPGFGVLAWTAIALFGVLVGGFFAMYRFALQQTRLARQQQNFVSAVSHELKTPLTSIRMYGEMLKSGWADEQKKQTYYEYIFDEGERLSRLIDNVLQLARLNNDGPTITAESVAVSELLDVIRSKLSSQAERAGFEIKFVIEPTASAAVISIDVDALTQVFINLIDNAIKFAGETSPKEIRVTARCPDTDSVILAIRDFGPGIPPAAMKRLFELFYRPDNELTRTTAGTGIGLALVKQLVTAMSGRVDVKNQSPGAEFRLLFPTTTVS